MKKLLVPLLLLASCVLSYYSLRTPPIGDQFTILPDEEPRRLLNPCLREGVEHRFQLLAYEMLEGRVSLEYTSLIVGPTDRLKRDELIMLCRVVSQDCRELRFSEHSKQ